MTMLLFALLVVASIWAAAHTTVAGYTAVNATRDRILTGRSEDGVPLTLPHRWLMYRHDWLPLKVGLALASLAFALLLIVLPELADDPGGLRWVCYLGAALPMFTLVSFILLGLSDRAHIIHALDETSRRGTGPEEASR